VKPSDVLVSGGGLAGATLAVLASRAGARVTVVERCRFPRDKVCGEFVSAEGCAVLARLGVLDGLLDRGVRRIGRWRASDVRGRTLEDLLPAAGDAGHEGLGVSRALLDTTLLELARAEGAVVLERTEARAPLVENGRVRGLIVRALDGNGGLDTLRAPVTVAADGRRSVLVRHLHRELGDPARTAPDSWFGLGVHLQGPPELAGGRVELHQFERGYAGLAAIEDDRLNLCLMTTVGSLRACGGSPERLYRERVLQNPALRAAIGGLPFAGPFHSIGPLRFGARRPAAPGVLFVGDAAGTVDPYSGMGMSHALRAAELALPFVLEAARRGELDRGAGAAYARRWRDAFGGVTRRVRWIAPVFERPGLGGAAVGVLSRVGGAVLHRLARATRPGA
jgi:flavin-dependent dehydrogenase